MFGTVEDYGEMFQDSVVQTKDASLSSTNQTGNPVPYKLVRVAEDGRLVPATDEDLLEVKDFIENNENDNKPIVPDPGQFEGYIPSEGSPSQLLQLESLQGLFQSETVEAFPETFISQLEAKEELMYGSQMLFSLPDAKFQFSNELSGNEDHIQSDVFLQEPVHFSSNGCITDQYIDVLPYSNATDSLKEPALTTPASLPDFSRVRDEMSFNNLSIKALQETFRDTFGRETTVKDKPWLKRKITMELVNSCVVPASNLPIEDNKVVTGGQDNCNDTVYGFSMDMVAEGRTTNCCNTTSSHQDINGHLNDFLYSPEKTIGDHYYGNEEFEGEHRAAKRVSRRYIEDISETDEKQQSDESVTPLEDIRGHSNDFLYSPEKTIGDHYSVYEDFEVEHRAAKRVRKLSRRYIEETSETDEKQQSDESVIPFEDIREHSNDFLYSPEKTIGDHYSGNEDFEGEHRSAKKVRKLSRRYIEETSETDEKQKSDESVIPLEDQRSTGAVSSGGRAVVTRMLSLGGSRIQVPYVYHVRRSRPRENIMALGEFHPSSWEVKAMPEKSNLNLRPTRLNDDLSRVSSVKPAAREYGPVKKESDKDDSKPIPTEVDQDSMEPEHLDSSGDSSDDNSNNVDQPITQKTGKKKQHRAWSLIEVTKLMEGVSKYGVGKWREIKKHSFPELSSRSAVDIKDKWRNLLKASFSLSQPNRMGSMRKDGSTTIPSQILLKVKELAQNRSRVSPVRKAASRVNGSRRGFL